MKMLRRTPLILMALIVGLTSGCAGQRTPATPADAQPPDLRLPATFRGDLPCADCQGIRYHLDLWPDHVFHLRREWLGRKLTQDELGRWRFDPARRVLSLPGEDDVPQF